MLFIGEATVVSSGALSLLASDVTGAVTKRKIRVLKLKNPRTSVGAGAFDWAAFSGQPATAPGLISPSTTTRPTTPNTTAELPEAVTGFTEAGAAFIDR
jgi:hypothetical protein